MRRYAFIISILGIAILLVVFTLPAKEIENISEIENLVLHKKIRFEAKIESVRDLGDFKIFNVEGIDVICECEGDFLGKIVEIAGYVDEFEREKQIRVLKIRVLD